MNKKVIVFGGGTGMSCLLKGLKKFPVDITAVVSVCDDGGSTGILRDEFDIPAVGDIRKILVSLSESDSSVGKLLNYRFDSNGTLDKHTAGNILITAAIEMTGSIRKATELLSKTLNLSGKVVPFTESNVDLCGEMEDGSIIKGEHYITQSDKKIKRVFYEKQPPVSKKLLNEIEDAGLIVMSMGSLYTSVLPCLLNDKIRKALDKSEAPIVYTCNLFTQPGETDDFKVSDHIKVINEYLGERKIDTVIANVGKYDRKLAKKYLQKEQKDIVPLDVKEVYKLVNDLIVDDLITIEDGVFRHDTLKLGFLLFSKILASEKKKEIFNK